MRTLSTILVASVTATAWAQPEITINNLPQLGDISTIGICSDAVNPADLNASAGAMQTWDFSGLTETSEEQFSFIDPSMTPWPNEFPGSTLCGVSWDDAYSYYTVGSTALSSSGNAIIIPGTPPEDTAKVLLTTDPETIIELPYSFGDGFTDNFSGTFSAVGFTGTVDGTSDLDIDGYGTLILPNATYTNVVRYHLDRVQNNTIFGTTTTITKEQWAWVSADHRFWLLLMEKNNDGFGVSDVVWYDKAPAAAGPTAVNTPERMMIGAYPNPVESGDPITISVAYPASGMTAELLDATGGVVRTQGRITAPLSTVGLVAGTYVLRVLEADGSRLGVSRVVLR